MATQNLNTGTSIVDYLKGQGKDSSFSARKTLASEKGIANYTGSAEQNTQLLSSLQAPPTTAAPAPVQNTTQVPAPTKEVAPFANEKTNIPNQPLPVTQLEKATTMPEPTTLVQKNAQDKTNLSQNIADVASTVANGNQKAIDNLKQQQQDLLAKQKAEAQKKADQTAAQIEEQAKSTASADALARDRELFKVEDTIRQLGDVNSKIAAAQDALNIGLVYEQGRPARLSIVSGRSNTLKNQGLATIGALQGVASVLQGNINLAKSYSDQTLAAIKEDNDRSVAALNTLLNLYNDKLVDLTQEERKVIDDRIKTLETENNQLEQDKRDILNLMTEYPSEFLKAGITLTDTKDEAMNKILPFLSEKALEGQYQLIDVGGRKKVYDPATQTIIKDLGESDDTTSKLIEIGTDSYGNKIMGVRDPKYPDDPTKYVPIALPNSATLSGDKLDLAVTDAFAGIEYSSPTIRREKMAHLKNLLQRGDFEKAKEFLKGEARNSLNGTQLDKLTGKEDLLVAIDGIQGDINQYVKDGGTLNLLVKAVNSAEEKGGFTDDPALSKLGNKIALVLFNYRKSMTGAVFTESEAEAYDKAFASTGKTPELNKAKLDAFREVTQMDVDNFYRRALGESNWDTLFAPTVTVPQLPPLNQSYTDLDTLLQKQPEYQSLYDQILDGHPEMTDEEIFSEMMSIASDFSQESQTSVNGGSSSSMSPLASSIVQQESGGNYSAVGQVPQGYSEADRALGKYQIVPKYHFDKIGLANTPANRQKFLRSPELQDKLFAMIIADLEKRYNNDPYKVAAAYYGGGKGASVVGTPAGDRPQYAGGKEYPSINQYAQSVVSRIS